MYILLYCLKIKVSISILETDILSDFTPHPVVQSFRWTGKHCKTAADKEDVETIFKSELENSIECVSHDNCFVSKVTCEFNEDTDRSIIEVEISACTRNILTSKKQ